MTTPHETAQISKSLEYIPAAAGQFWSGAILEIERRNLGGSYIPAPNLRAHYGRRHGSSPKTPPKVTTAT